MRPNARPGSWLKRIEPYRLVAGDRRGLYTSGFETSATLRISGPEDVVGPSLAALVPAGKYNIARIVATLIATAGANARELWIDFESSAEADQLETDFVLIGEESELYRFWQTEAPHA